MADTLALLLEAEKRGLLPPDKLDLLNEARSRGIVQKEGRTVGEDSVRQDDMTGTQAALASAGNWLDSKAAGLRSGVRDYIPGGPAIVGALDNFDKWRGVQTPTDESRAAAEPAMAALTKAHPVASFAGELAPSMLTVNPLAMGAMAALDPGSMGERAGRAGLAFGAGKVGELAGGKIAEMLSKRGATKAADRAAAEAQNLARDTTVGEAQAAGYVFPPDQINPSMLNRALVGLSGKASTAQGAAIKNQEVTNELAKKALGIPESVPLTKETLSQVRGIAGEAYKVLKGFGPVKADDEFGAAIQGVTGEYRALLHDFPSQRNAAIDSLIEDLGRPQFNSASAVELVKRLRSDGRANLKAFDDPAKKALGQVQMGAQGAIEDLLDRNLQATGNGEFLQVFRNARAMIAKTHTVEDALEESTGKIVAGKIGKEYGKGRPLTGELATIGKMAQAFPKSVQNINTSMPGLSPLDYMGGILTGSAAGGTAGLATAMARPIARGALLSGPYQKAMAGAPSYEAGAIEKLLASIGNDPEKLKRLGGLLGLGAQQAYR